MSHALNTRTVAMLEVDQRCARVGAASVARTTCERSSHVIVRSKPQQMNCASAHNGGFTWVLATPPPRDFV